MTNFLIKVLYFLFPKTCKEIYQEGYTQAHTDYVAILSYDKDREREENTLKIKIGAKQ